MTQVYYSKLFWKIFPKKNINYKYLLHCLKLKSTILFTSLNEITFALKKKIETDKNEKSVWSLIVYVMLQ